VRGPCPWVAALVRNSCGRYAAGVRIRVWTAFASNNSGSYTIVGRFAEAERAAEVAAELAEMIAAHTAWHAEHMYEDSEDSPIVAFARARGLAATAALGAGDEWPQYGEPPSVTAVDRQVVVHAPYTVSLPRTFGELFYARGGAVDTCLDHAHEALVVHFEAWWPWQWDAELRALGLAGLLAAVQDPGSPVWAHVRAAREEESGLPQLVCARDLEGSEAPLVIAAVFADLIAGVAALAALAAVYGAEHRVRIFEALDHRDPLSHLRGAASA